MKREEELLTSVEIGTLCAYYGGLLTEKQREALRLHFDEDDSLGEIAAEAGISRQSVHELVTRSAGKLRHYEETLGLVRKARETAAALRQVNGLIEKAREGAPESTAAILDAASRELSRVISRQEGEENDYGI